MHQPSHHSECVYRYLAECGERFLKKAKYLISLAIAASPRPHRETRTRQPTRDPSDRPGLNRKIKLEPEGYPCKFFVLWYTQATYRTVVHYEVSMRQRGKDKSKQKPTDPDKVWSKEKDRQAFHKTPLAAALADFETFRNELLPMLRKDVLEGMAPEAMRKKYEAFTQARQIMEALTNPDARVALAAIDKMQDRVEGKPTEKREVTHKFDNMSDKELDAVLKSEEEDLEAMSERFKQ